MSLIELRPFSSEGILALIDGVSQCEQQMGLRVDPALRDFFVSGEISEVWMDMLRASKGENPWIHGFAVVEGDTLVGTAGFKGPPDNDGVVEIAYGIVPSREGRGYATDAAKGLIEFDQRILESKEFARTPFRNPTPRRVCSQKIRLRVSVKLQIPMMDSCGGGREIRREVGPRRYAVT
jgi:RimJ/RimL family protein N-acetyltransferase